MKILHFTTPTSVRSSSATTRSSATSSTAGGYSRTSAKSSLLYTAAASPSQATIAASLSWAITATSPFMRCHSKPFSHCCDKPMGQRHRPSTTSSCYSRQTSTISLTFLIPFKQISLSMCNTRRRMLERKSCSSNRRSSSSSNKGRRSPLMWGTALADQEVADFCKVKILGGGGVFCPFLSIRRWVGGPRQI
jgi:hypothetical protein